MLLLTVNVYTHPALLLSEFLCQFASLITHSITAYRAMYCFILSLILFQLHTASKASSLFVL